MCEDDITVLRDAIEAGRTDVVSQMFAELMSAEVPLLAVLKALFRREISTHAWTWRIGAMFVTTSGSNGFEEDKCWDSLSREPYEGITHTRYHEPLHEEDVDPRRVPLLIPIKNGARFVTGDTLTQTITITIN